MFDFTVEPFYHCKSATYFQKKVIGSKGDVHTVELSDRNPGECQVNWSCSCTGFKYHHTCSHIKKVQKSEEYCGWMQFTDGGEPKIDPATGEKCCPRCGGELEILSYAV